MVVSNRKNLHFQAKLYMQPLEVLCKERFSYKFCKIHNKMPVPGSLFYQAYDVIKKETRAQVFSREFGKVLKNTFFTEHLRATASVINY